MFYERNRPVNQNVLGAKRVTNFLRYGGLLMRVLGVIANYTCLV